MMKKRTPCPDCPDGYVWTSRGQTDAACPTCNGNAYIEQDADREMFGSGPEAFGLENIGNK